MKKKLITLIALLCVMVTCVFGFVACGDNPPEDNRDSQIVAIYNTYVAYAEENDTTPLSYDEWLLTIKGEKGDAGVGIESAYVNDEGYLIIVLSDDNNTEINAGKVKDVPEVSSATFKTLTVEEATLTGNVAYEINSFDFNKEIILKGDASFAVYYEARIWNDALGRYDTVNCLLDSVVYLSYGENNFNVRVSVDGETTYYQVSIYRETRELDEYNYISFKTMEVEEGTASLTISEQQETFSFVEEIEKHGYATYHVFIDALPSWWREYTLEELKENYSFDDDAIVNLDRGSNTFYVLESCGEDLNLYTVKIANGVDPAKNLQIWCKKAGYGVDWLYDALEAFVEEDWVKEKYGTVTYDEPDTDGLATSGLDWLVGGGTDYDIVMPTGGLTSGTYLDNYNMFEDLTSLYNTTIPGEENTLIQKMIPEIAADNLLTIKGHDNPVRYSIPWVNGAHGWFYNETTLKQYLMTVDSDWTGDYATMPRTTNEFISMLDDVKDAIYQNPKTRGKDWAIYHHAASASYWTSDATVWWAQYDGINGYNNYFELQNEYDEVDMTAAAENTESIGRLRGLQALDDIISYENGYVWAEDKLDSYTVTLGWLRYGIRCVFTSNGDWVENETDAYKKNGEILRMMKTPVISSIVEKLSFGAMPNADEILSEIIRCIDLGMNVDDTARSCIQMGVDITEDDYITVKLARNTVSRIGGYGMYIPSYSDAKPLAKDFMLFLASDKGIEIMIKNGIYSCYNYDYTAKADVTANLSQMRKDFIKIMDDARDVGGLLRNPESFASVYYGKFKPWSSLEYPHIGQAFLAKNGKTPEQVWQGCFKTATDMAIINAATK